MHVNDVAPAQWFEVGRTAHVSDLVGPPAARPGSSPPGAAGDRTALPGRGRGSRLTRLGTKSLTTGCGIFRGDDCIAASGAANDFYDMGTRRTVVPPAEVRALLETEQESTGGNLTPGERAGEPGPPPACWRTMRRAGATTDFPRAAEADSTFAFLREGYPFITNRCRALGSDAFRARMMLTPVLFTQGAEASEMFYAPGRFTRKGAVPFTAVKMLQDYGSVQTLDGAAHAHRKRMFMAMMSDEPVDRMVSLAAGEWRDAAAGWAPGRRVRLLDAAQLVLTRAVLRWAGLAAGEEDVQARARDYAAMLGAAGNLGAGAWLRGAVLRSRNERWARRIIEDVRAGRLSPVAHEAARIVALHRDIHGRLLPVKVAAVELLNVFRPVVAVGHFIVHAALALHRHGDWRTRLAGADEAEVERFVQEVRRLAPFFPAVAGRVREPFDWRGRRLDPGAWVVLDLWGTNRDPRAWDDPEAFRPERFADWDGSPWTFVPQGGGPYVEGHRCPGEWLTIGLMKQAVRFLARDLDYTVPRQDLGVDLARIPAIPASGFVMEIRR